MKLKLSQGMIVGPYPHYVLVIALFLGGMQLAGNEKYGWTSSPLIAIAALLAIVPLAYFLITRLNWIKVFPVHGDGKQFFVERLRELGRRGGEIFSTYLIERADETDDLVTDELKKLSTESGADVSLRYDRLIMIDDPTLEEQWINSFFRTVQQPITHVSISPTVYAIKSPKRSWVRFIQSVLPRASITLIAYADKPDDRLVYVSISRIVALDGSEYDPEFAVAIRNDIVFDRIKKILDKILESTNLNIRKMTSPTDYIQKTPRALLPPLSERLISEIEEIAVNNIHIMHVGVFGSVAKAFERYVNSGASWRPESDLDLIVVLAEMTDQEEIKRLIEKRFELQANSKEHGAIEIEWSIERQKFYYFRKGFHVDIQLHYSHDKYYSETARLLGYSIFWGNYHVLYSDRNLPVESYLVIPSEPLTETERIKLFVNGDLGLDEFIGRCEKVDINIDPRRVIAINLANFVWTLTGMRPVFMQESLDFLYRFRKMGNAPSSNCIMGLDDTTFATIGEIFKGPLEGPGQDQERYLSKCVDMLKHFKSCVELRYAELTKTEIKPESDSAKFN